MAGPWNPFDRLTPAQRAQLDAYRDLLLHFNRKINLISQDTEAHFDERHLLHTMALTMKMFPPDSVVVDWGTGGGLPAVPLAICFPEVSIHAVDAVEKKVRAVQAIARRLDLANLQAWHARAEAWPGRAHYSVSRATAPLLDLWRWHLRVGEALLSQAKVEAWQPGLVCLKGGDLLEERAALLEAYSAVVIEECPLQPLLKRAYFAGKYIVHVR